MKTMILCVIILFTTSQYVQADGGIVKGRVTDTKNQVVEYATAVLIHPKTGEIARGSVCNGDGNFVMEGVAFGEYLLSVRMLGYETSESEPVILDNEHRIVEKKVMLKETSQQLQEAVVKGKYAFVEQAVDKTIVNPNASIVSSSETVYEILKKSPGVDIDNNDNITLKGMQGVVIMIDEKPTRVSGKELAPILKGMLGKHIRSIEIIENPSARYDAEGNSGIINIKTKHSKAPGFNGSVNAGATLTRSLGGNAGADLNMNFGKMNVYGNYAFYDWKGWYKMEGIRRFRNDEDPGQFTLMSNESNSNGDAHNYKLGADWYLAESHVVSLMFSGNKGSNRMLDDGLTAFKNSDHAVDSSVISSANRLMAWQNMTFNANYKWDLDTLGRSLIVDADYARFLFEGDATQTSDFFKYLASDIPERAYLTSLYANTIDIFSARADYTHPLSKTYFFEAGIKSSRVSIDSKSSMFGYLDQQDKFLYDEVIQAAYVSGRAQIQSTIVQLGLRVENTFSEGNSVSTDQIDKNSYVNVFPSVFLQQQLAPEQTLGFRYSYRIGRPNYHALNPFKWMMDPYTYNLGNPGLKPQFTQALSLNHAWKGKVFTTLGYNYSTDLFTEVIYQDDETREAYQITENFGNTVDVNLSETVQLQPARWWRLGGTAVAIYKEVKARESIGGQLSSWGFIGNLNNSFTLPRQISLEVNGKYVSKQLNGNFLLKPFYTIDLGMQMQVLNGQGVLRLSVSDLFKTGSTGVLAQYGNLELDVMTLAETRRLQLSFSYRFGKSEFKTRANRATSSKEERDRSSK